MNGKMISREFKKNDYLISTDRKKLQIDVIHNFLSNSYWSPNIPLEKVKTLLDNSLCFGLYKKDSQIGFARLVTDYATFAYLADVFILEEYRGQGLSKWLMEIVLSFPEVKGLRSWMLKTKDAHRLYKQFGFDAPIYPDRVMEYKPPAK